MKPHAKKIINELCNYLGQDLNQPMCKELWEHVQNCPECQTYLSTIKLTVEIIRDANAPQNAPEAVKENIFKILKLK